MDMERFFEIWPYCYHVTSETNLPSLRHSRILSPAEVLFRKAGQNDLIRQRRLVDVLISIDGKDVRVRNQSPLDPEAIDLGGWGFLEDYIRWLNGRVFFWPGTEFGPVEEGTRMFHRSEGHSIFLRIPTRSLMLANRTSEAYVSTCNTGVARLIEGQKSRRGPWEFYSAIGFLGSPTQIVEVSFVDSVFLTSDTVYAMRLGGLWMNLFSSSVEPDRS
jgi:hypothetical protein